MINLTYSRNNQVIVLQPYTPQPIEFQTLAVLWRQNRDTCPQTLRYSCEANAQRVLVIRKKPPLFGIRTAIGGRYVAKYLIRTRKIFMFYLFRNNGEKLSANSYNNTNEQHKKNTYLRI